MSEVEKQTGVLSKKEFRGGKREGAGRKPGIPNKVTTAFRETVSQLLDDNRENVAVWLRRVAAEDPGKALDLVAKLAEYAAPKLARTEVVGDPAQPLHHTLDISNLTDEQKRVLAGIPLPGEGA